MGLHLVGGMLHSGKKSSIFVTGSYSFRAVHMQDLLTTDEAATYLRLSERKLYELVANGAVPCTKVTGKWLFPNYDLYASFDRQIAALRAQIDVRHSPNGIYGMSGR
jgi:excisionase family DNA binding protein